MWAWDSLHGSTGEFCVWEVFADCEACTGVRRRTNENFDYVPAIGVFLKAYRSPYVVPASAPPVSAAFVVITVKPLETLELERNRLTAVRRQIVAPTHGCAVFAPDLF